MLGSLLKAAAGLALDTPLALAKDTLTLGGAITGEREPATVSALRRLEQNLVDASSPKDKR